MAISKIVQNSLNGGVVGNGPSFSGYMTNGGSNLSLSSGTYTKVKIDTENWDTDNCFDSTTNYRFTPNVAGYYFISAGLFINYSMTSPSNCAALIYKNGSAYRESYILTNGITNLYGAFTVSSLIYFNGTTDYVELYAYQTSSGNAYIIPGTIAPPGNWFDGCLVRAA